MNKFALIVESREATNDINIVTKEGEKFLVTVQPEGWVEATSTRLIGKLDILFNRTKLFDSVEEATKFAKRWAGHPWWCIPNGKFEIVEVQPVFKQMLDGYKVVNTTQEIK